MGKIAETTNDLPGRGRGGDGRRGDGLLPSDVIGAFFLAGIAYMLAGAAVAVAGGALSWGWTRWLALHLVFVGGVSQLVLGASQFFAAAYLATEPPPRRLIRAQLAVWNAGALGLAIAVPAGSAALSDLAGLALAGAVGLYLLGLTSLRRRSLASMPFATRWYAAAAAFLAVGIIAGALLARGAPWSHGDLLGTHLTLNLGGWLGTAIVGTLHGLYPAIARARLAHPGLERWAFALWVGGVGALATGYALSADPPAAAGWAALASAAILLGVNVARCVLAAPRPLTLSARLLAAGQALLVAGIAVGLAAALAGGPAAPPAGATRAALAAFLVAGWIGLTVLGSLLHLLAAVVYGRDPSRPPAPPRPAPEIALCALAVAGVVALAAAHGAGLESLRVAAIAGLATAYAALVAMILRLAGRLLAAAPPSV